MRYPLMTAASELSGSGGAGGAGAGSGAAGAAAASGAGAGSGSGAAAGDHWTTSIEDEGLRGWVQSRGWEGPSDALKAHRELEGLRGVPADRLVRLPENAEDADGWREVHRRLGAPENADGYELPTAELGEGQVDITADFRQWAHKAGLTQSQAKGLLEQYSARMAQIVESDAQAREERTTVEMGELKKSWGQEYDANLLHAKNAAQKLGMQEADLNAIEDALGSKRTMELFCKIGRGVAEFRVGSDEGGAPAPFGMTPDAARAQITQLRADPKFMEATLNPNSEERAKIDRLYKIAGP